MRNDRKATIGLSRRRFMRRTAEAALIGVAAPALTAGSAQAEDITINMSTYGGVLNDYLSKLFVQPFEKETGIRVNLGGNASLTLAKLQVASNSPAQWDIMSLTGAEYLAAIEQNLILPYDYEIIGTKTVPNLTSAAD